MLCSAVAALGLSLAGCEPAQRAQTGQPSFYVNLGSPDAKLDRQTARAMISAYRQNNGLEPLILDAGLVEAAMAEAGIMAAADKPSSADAIKNKLSQRGLGAVEVNLSAGYRTLAEAFSGWRDSPQHDHVMKARNARRMGIATAYAPGSKYLVYWALVVAP